MERSTILNGIFSTISMAIFNSFVPLMGQVRPHHLGNVLRNFRGRQVAACRGRGGIHAPTTKIFQDIPSIAK